MPRDRSLRGSPTVVEFDGGERTFGVQCVSEPPKARDHGVAVQSELVGSALSVCANVCRFGSHHAESGPCPGHEVIDVLIGDPPVSGAVVAFHGSGGQAVPEGFRGAAVAAKCQGAG
ncbi:hypothetical protein PJL18_03761 [Paenarthrobacter nicotinovorans]|nr:hypothetical protein [Paenarthrobacter nicotinovorans]